MWWKTSLNNLVNLTYSGKGSKELIKDWLVAYEYDTGDTSLRKLKRLDILTSVLYHKCNTAYEYSSMSSSSSSVSCRMWMNKSRSASVSLGGNRSWSCSGRAFHCLSFSSASLRTYCHSESSSLLRHLSSSWSGYEKSIFN